MEQGNHRETFPRMAWQSDNEAFESLIDEIYTLSMQKNISQLVKQAFIELLKLMRQRKTVGACHDTSAVLFVLLSELGLAPILYIGAVRAPEGVLDHSWVELSGEIFDIAIALPQPIGKYVSEPIFASTELVTFEKTALKFGIFDPNGLDQDAQTAFDRTLGDYAKDQDNLSTKNDNIWRWVVQLAPMVGLSCTIQQLTTKYGHIRRKYRNN